MNYCLIYLISLILLVIIEIISIVGGFGWLIPNLISSHSDLGVLLGIAFLIGWILFIIAGLIAIKFCFSQIEATFNVQD